MSVLTTKFNDIIRRVITDNHSVTGRKLREKVNQACPFHDQEGDDYETWAVCVNKYLGPDTKAPEASKPIPDQWWEQPIKAEGNWIEDREMRGP